MDVSRLTAFPIFADVDPADLQRLAEAATERMASSGEAIVHEGDFGYTVMLIEEGTADVLKGEAVVASLGPGDVFGEIAVEQAGRRSASVVATSDLRLIVILNRDLWRVERLLPDIATRMRETAQARSLRAQVVGDTELRAVGSDESGADSTA